MIAQAKRYRERSLQLRQTLRRSPTACKILFRRRQRDIRSEMLQERLEFLQTKTLILQTNQDDERAVALAQTYAELCPNAKLKNLILSTPGSYQDLAAAIALAVQSFIKD